MRRVLFRSFVVGMLVLSNHPAGADDDVAFKRRLMELSTGRAGGQGEATAADQQSMDAMLRNAERIADGLNKPGKTQFEFVLPGTERFNKALEAVPSAANGPELAFSRTLREQQEKQAREQLIQGNKTFVFLSLRLGDHALRDTLRRVAGRDDVVAVFRGIEAGKSITAMAQRLHGLIGTVQPIPNVVIDPTLFSRYGVTAVPTMVRIEDGRVAGRVAGIVAPEYLDDRLAAGERGDFGVEGPTSEITEADLMDEIQRRVLAYDFEAAKKRAVANYWKKADLIALPEATESRVRRVDPTFQLRQDVVAKDGTVIGRAGQKYNPLQMMAFNQVLVVFDGQDPRHVAIAKGVYRENLLKRRVTLITTSVDRTHGWENVKAMDDDFEAPVFVLTDIVRKRFGIERIPCVVEQDGDAFRVREIVPPVR